MVCSFKVASNLPAYSEIEPVLAKQLARGEVDPVDLLPMPDICPNFRPKGLKQVPMVATNVGKKGKGREVATKPKPTGGILSFFGQCLHSACIMARPDLFM